MVALALYKLVQWMFFGGELGQYEYSAHFID